jgi:5-methylcytosine-specific restriction endonuclease McrA
MNTNLLALASSLTDPDLLARLAALAGKEREASVELVAHLAELDTRASLYAAHSYGSLFTYCTEVLRLSEDAACNRISAARACRRFPVILDALASGALSLTSVRMLSPHLTQENHEAVLSRASSRSRREIEALVAELAPRPDVPSSVRKLPAVTPPAAVPVSATAPLAIEVKATTVTAPGSAPPTNVPAVLPATAPATALPATALSVTAPLAARRPIVETMSPERYRVQFTIGREPGAIFDRAIALLLEKVEKRKLGAATQPRAPRPIRPGADSRISSDRLPSRHTPNDVKRSTWRNDGGQCAFVSKDGRRCTERAFLEFHHIRPYALGGPTSTDNISLRCRRHNQYEAELVFGPRTRSIEGDS